MHVPTHHDPSPILRLRREILGSPFRVGLARAETYTRVFQENEDAPWIVAKAMAFREHLRTVPLFVREGDLLAGALAEAPGAMNVNVEIGIGENAIFTSENPQRAGYLVGAVPERIVAYWEHRNLWGRHRARMRETLGIPQEPTRAADYRFLSCQGHLSPSYSELLNVGLGGVLERVTRCKTGETDRNALDFLDAAEISLRGVSHWIERYAARLDGEAASVAARVATEPPRTFREAMQLVWFAHQAIHIEGHGYSNTPDRLDQLLYPFYLRDIESGTLTAAGALTLIENLILKMRDNTFWSVEHNLTQGLCVGGSGPDGLDQTNELAWLTIEAADRMSLPEPLVWLRWHANMDQAFFDFCLAKLAGKTCFPLMMSDSAVPAMFMGLGVDRQDAFNYVPVGCNELAIPGMAYFCAAAHVDYLGALRHAMEDAGRGASFETFDHFAESVGLHMSRQVEASYRHGMVLLESQIRWGQAPFTSCFFHGCIEQAHDMMEGTRYNLLSCGGTAFANIVDSLAAIREVVYEKREATIEQIAEACRRNFDGRADLRRRLLAAPKHGNDDPRLQDIVTLVERLRDEPVKSICRDPRDGTPFGNCHVVRSSAVTEGRRTPATPDGRLSGTPLASSVAASCGSEHSGPTAVLNSVLQMSPTTSWQSGYNVNLRLQRRLLADPPSRSRVRAMLNAYFAAGGQEMQINSVDTDTLRRAQADPASYGDLVVRVAGFSEFFVNLDHGIQEDVIRRTEHA